MTNARRAELGRLGAASAAVVVALAAVLTAATLVRSGSDQALGDSAGPSGPDTSAPRTGEVTTGAVPDSHGALPPARPTGLSIPAIDLDTGALIELGRTPAGTAEVPGTAGAVGWFAENPTPGERGAAVLTGHADFAYERGAFHRLHRLRPGDTVSVRRQDGAEAVFTVYRVETRPASTTFAPAGQTRHPELRLLTASVEFGRSSGGQRDTVVVFARLTDVALT
ncbi:sortase domain-containing protein [Qaidamihabitans albus]|uniref:sortase domain-containing protein n=1 Tax=Qaidamihabitans albus TaxID=2795733 RepID=UPI0027DAFA0D|nr:sortase [Qaidamihabitans albus]